MCLSNFIAMRQFKVPISWLWDFTRSYEKTSFRILRRGPGAYQMIWWHHQMETLCEGNSPVTGEFPSQRPVTQGFDVFFFICTWTNGWENNLGADDVRYYHTHCDITVMISIMAARVKDSTGTGIVRWNSLNCLLAEIGHFTSSQHSPTLTLVSYHLSLVQIMAWCRTGDKPLSEPILQLIGWSGAMCEISLWPDV